MHAVIEARSLEISLIDLGSTRGTFVNGTKINKARLVSGDVISIGDVRIEFAIGDAILPVRRPSPERAEARPPALPAAARPPTLPAAARRPPLPAPSPVAVPPPVPAIAAAVVPVRAVAGPVEPAADPVVVRRMVAAPADELGGAGAIEVAAMLGDSVVSVAHCVDPRGGKVTPATWGLFAGGIACLLASAIGFVASVHNETDNARRYATWTRVEHRPAYAFRPHRLGTEVDWLAFGGLVFGLVGLSFGVWRIGSERTSPYYRIGTAPGVEFASAHAPLPAFPLVAPSGDDFVFNYGDGIDGELILDGTSIAFAELVATGRARPSAGTAGAIEVPIPPKARIRARAGQTTFLVSSVARPRRHAAPLIAHLERRALSYVAGSLAVHLGIWALLQTIPPDAAGASVELPAEERTLVQVKGAAQEAAPPEQPADTGTGTAGGGQADPAQMKLPSGAAGNPNAAKLGGHMEVAHRDDQPRLSRDELRALMSREGVLGSEGLANAIQVLGAESNLASGFDARDVNGPLLGADGEGRGNFGGGLTGTQLGGGCLEEPCGTIGTRPGYGKIRLDPRANGFGFPPGIGPHGRGHQTSVPDIGPPVISRPTYDKSIVRRYIRRHLNEIGYCYEKELLAHPNLGGDVKVMFFIGPTGAVQSSSGTGFDDAVGSCLAGVVKTIEFPPPGDGGVQVNYPFHFHAPGT
jgi:hypothetical protein